MNKNIGMVLTFIGGVIVGVASAYKVAETKYRNIANEEIDSVVERFANRSPMQCKEETVATKKVVADEIVEEPAPKSSKNRVADYQSEVAKVGYNTMSSTESKPTKKGRKGKVKPVEEKPHLETGIYVITPDEFNTIDEYTTRTFYYSCDNYVLDDEYHILDDEEIRRYIGHDPIGSFGEYEDDCVHVRNENNMTDYEILLSEKTADEITED